MWKNSGFTLLELMIVIAIVGIIGTFIYEAITNDGVYSPAPSNAVRVK